MKTISYFFIGFLSLQLSAQTNKVIDNFKLFELEGKVLLNWQIVSGSTCNGIGIFRSINQSDFIEIGEIAGVCGYSNDPVGYKFIDVNPIKNQINYYRLEARGNGFSQILSIEIIESPRIDLQFFPNPVITTSKLYFENKNKIAHHLFIYNSSGKLIETLSTNSDFFTISSLSFQSGVYFFSLLTPSNTFVSKGKFIVP